MKFLKPLIGGALLIVANITSSSAADEIVFAKKNFYDNEGFVGVSGTLTGSGMAYPNNTYAISCYKDRKECLISYVQQIGPNQIGRMENPYPYPVATWGRDEVVTIEEVGPTSCSKTTITINPKSERVLWVEEPINQSKTFCARSETAVRKFTIENSPGWDKIFGKK